MLIPRLAARSLRSRLLTTALTVASIALSVTLLVGIEHVRSGVRDSFAGTIRGTDLIVGARGGSLQVLLSSVFGIGSPAGSVDMATFERWQRHPAVKWAVPISLGDSHRGFRVIGTTPEYFARYRYRQDAAVTFATGGPPTTDTDVVIGSEVAERLRYGVGSPVVVVHGLQDIGTSSHEAHPFRVVGVLNRTFTPIDRAIYVTLEGIEAMHEEEEKAPTPGRRPRRHLRCRAPKRHLRCRARRRRLSCRGRRRPRAPRWRCRVPNRLPARRWRCPAPSRRRRRRPRRPRHQAPLTRTPTRRSTTSR